MKRHADTNILALGFVPAESPMPSNDYEYFHLGPLVNGTIQIVNAKDQFVLRVHVKNDLIVTWAAATWGGGKTAEDFDDAWWHIQMDGSGTAGGLRECRHTYFGERGENGYVFYADPAFIAWVFKQLEQWFDF